MTDLPIVDCVTCGGKCCSRIRTPPFVRGLRDGERFKDDDIWDQLTAAQKSEIESHIMSDAPDDSPCLWFRDARCIHYELRPGICRDFEMGGDDCLSWDPNHTKQEGRGLRARFLTTENTETRR